METVKELREIGKAAVQRLRKRKLESGRPFMVWSKELPKEQSYLEFPDHTIKIVVVSSSLKSFTVVEELTSFQAEALRERLSLI